MAVRAGEEVKVTFKTPFQTAPRITLGELKQSYFREVPYRRDTIQVVQVQGTAFRLANTHQEKHCGSWATVAWRAEGVRGDERALSPAEAAGDREQTAALIRRWGGKVQCFGNRPDGPIVAVDLHATGVGDAQLDVLRAATTLGVLNLHATRVTDSGLAKLGGLTSLRTLYLNETAVTDAGLRSLRPLRDLKELGLSRTAVTDAGLTSLVELRDLQSLALEGDRVTDAGIPQLKKLSHLRSLFLTGTQVSPAGMRDLHAALPRTHIFR